MPRFATVLHRALPACALTVALIALPTTTVPNLLSGAVEKSMETRIELGTASKVGVAQSGPPTKVNRAPHHEATKAAPSPDPGGAQDVVADVPLPDGGGLMALTWAADSAPPADAELLLRTRDGDGWSDWESIGPNGDVDPQALGQTRAGSDPAWLPSAERVQVRASKGLAAALDTARLVVIRPGTGPSSDQPPSSASAVSNGLPIITRARWGADESLRGGCVPQLADTTKAVVVHHTADTNSYTASESAGIVRSILRYHTQSLGWCDVGYNALVDKYGQIFEGRFGGLHNSVIGAHALGFNYGTFGVSVLGNYETATLPTVARTALASVIAMRVADYRLDATGTTQLTSADSGSRYPAGSTVTLPVINGHRDTFATACPGANIYSLLGQLRSEVKARAGTSDGRPRLFAVRSNGDLLRYAGDGRGAFVASAQIGSGWSGLRLTASTWDNDLVPDLLAVRPDGGMDLWRGTSSGVSGPTRIGSGWSRTDLVLSPGDFSGDRRPDVIGRRSDGTLWLYGSDGMGGFVGDPRLIGSDWQGFLKILAPGDFDGDGRPDLIAETAVGDLILYPGNGSGGFLASRKIGNGWRSAVDLVAPGDFDGDLRPDLVMTRSDGSMWLYPGNGAGGFEDPRRVGSDWQGLTLVP